MDIGIVVYSWSGNTRSVADRLKPALEGSGHSVRVLDVLLTTERDRGARIFEFADLPDLEPFDALVFGAAVEAFSLSPVLAEYLRRVLPLAGKKVACLVTQQFPYPWLGGNRAIRQMKRLCTAKQGTVIGSAIVNWAASHREATTARAIDRLSKAF